MNTRNETTKGNDDLRCPTCRAALKRRRSRHADECEMICGGCGESFDVCDLDTVDRLKSPSS